jgi:hypothetical protein
MKIGSHLQGYMRAGSMAEHAVYMLLQEKQLSNFSPLYFEFSRFSDGSKPNSSPRCRHSLRNDGAKISNLVERCNIVSRFFHFGGKNSVKRPILQVLFCPFRSKGTNNWSQCTSRTGAIYTPLDKYSHYTRPLSLNPKWSLETNLNNFIHKFK